MNKLSIKTLVIFIFFSIFLLPHHSFARIKRPHYNPDITQSSKYAALIVNADTGEILYRKDANKLLHPASLTKMASLWLTFQALEEKKLHLNQYLTASAKAASQPKTRLGLRAGERIAVKDLIYAVIIHSANDAAVVLAEAISGTEEAFAAKMTETAQLLGMQNTVFRNAHGLHHPQQVTTAYDMAKLGIALRRDYAKYYSMFSKTSFIYKGTLITGHNRVLTKYQWADGLKTGFINASGFNLVTSAVRPEGKIVGVVMGGPSAAVRDNHMIALLEQSFSKLNANDNRRYVAEHNSSPFSKFQSTIEEASSSGSNDIFANIEDDVITSSSDQIASDYNFANVPSNSIKKNETVTTIKESYEKKLNLKSNKNFKRRIIKKARLKKNIKITNAKAFKKPIKKVNLLKVKNNKAINPNTKKLAPQ